MPEPPILLLPEKADPEISRVMEVCEQKCIPVKRLGKYWIKDEELTGKPIAVYGNQVFCMVLAQVYNLTYISPDDILITRLNIQWTKRTLRQTTIRQLKPGDFPVFIKSVIPKIFMAGVFSKLTHFKNASRGIDESEEIMVSTIIDDLQAEARAWVMNGIIKDIALYQGDADLTGAIDFLHTFLLHNKHLLPEVVVIDLAYSSANGWCILEFNACWGAGLNNCKAEKVIDCIIAATVNR